MTAPRYQDVQGKDVPDVVDDDGTAVRIVCGAFWGKAGPVEGIAAEPRLPRHLDPAGEAQDLAGGDVEPRVRVCLRGGGEVLRRLRPLAVPTDLPRGPIAHHRRTPTIDRSFSSTEAMRWRCRRETKASGSCSSPASPIEEPVAWYGPIVMNTQEELRVALDELNRGTFIK